MYKIDDNPYETVLDALLRDCAGGDKAAFARLVNTCLPRMLGLSGEFLEQAQHREEVCRDTLLLAWRNIHEPSATRQTGRWLYQILGSRLYSQLLAVQGSRHAVICRLSNLPGFREESLPSPTGPRPAVLGSEPLLTLAEAAPSAVPSRRLLDELDDLVTAEIAQRQAPLTPTGERVYPPLYDPALRGRMFRSRTAFNIKEGFKRRWGRPFEDWLFARWLEGKRGSELLEAQGLPRRSIEAYLDGKLDLDIDPGVLETGINFPASFPNRSQRRKISNLFIWSGDWDLVTEPLTESQRRHFITDLWEHRLDLTASASYAELMDTMERGTPLRSHHHGFLLNSEQRIVAYLRRYLLYMEDMHCFGFKPRISKDQLGVVIDRQGRIIKSNKGLHRLAMAQVLGIQRVSVRVRGIHRLWWEQHKEGAEGREALDNITAALSGTLLSSG